MIPHRNMLTGLSAPSSTALRDGARNEVVGLLEREGAYDWRDPPIRHLITRRNGGASRHSHDHDPSTQGTGRHMQIEITPLADPYRQAEVGRP